jgi:hypothetical protein
MLLLAAESLMDARMALIEQNKIPSVGTVILGCSLANAGGRIRVSLHRAILDAGSGLNANPSSPNCGSLYRAA